MITVYRAPACTLERSTENLGFFSGVPGRIMLQDLSAVLILICPNEHAGAMS